MDEVADYVRFVKLCSETAQFIPYLVSAIIFVISVYLEHFYFLTFIMEVPFNLHHEFPIKEYIHDIKNPTHDSKNYWQLALTLFFYLWFFVDYEGSF